MACTGQRTVGPWHPRLPHFRPDRTPASGDELQTEYFVPWEHAPAAIATVTALGTHIRPVLLLTARTAEIDRVQGLDLGADDYITKPFGLAELLARVRAHLRRSATNGGAQPSVIEFDGLTLDLARRELRCGESPRPLRPKEYQLLAYLAQHPGRTCTRDELLNDVWDIDFVGGTRTVDVHIRWLRKKIEPDPAQPVHLITVRGAGYRFEL